MTAPTEQSNESADLFGPIFRTVFEQSPVSTQIFAPDGTMIAANRAWEERWGVSVEQLRGYNILEDQQLVEKGAMPYIMRAFAGEPAIVPPIKYVPDETIPGISPVAYRWASASVYPVKDAEGNVREVVLMHEDITERMQREVALRESEELFRATFEGASIGIALVDFSCDLSDAGRTFILRANRAYQEMMGYSEDELKAMPFSTYTHPEDVPEQTRLNEDLMAGRRSSYQVEKRYIRKDGKLIWARLNVTLAGRDGGEPVAIAMVEDVTERREAEEALRRSEERFRAIFDEAPVGISVVDHEGRYLAVNPVREEMLGYRAEELLGRSYLEFTHPDDVEYDREVNATARQLGRNRYQLEKRFTRPNGESGWTRVTVRIVRDEQDEVIYSVAVAEDITERKRVEEERARLYELERTMRRRVERLAAEQSAMLSQLAEGVIMADAEGRLTFVNDEARRIYGVAELGVDPEHYSDVYHVYTLGGEPYPSLDLPLARAVRGGEVSVNVPLRIRRPDGTEVFAQANASPVVGEDGTRLGAVLAVRDVTAQYELERQKDDFLSAAAHDLRTPLTSMKGRIQLLRRRAERGTLNEQQFIEDLNRIDAGLSRMTALIGELLDVANLQIGRPLGLNRMDMDLIELARTVVSEHERVSDRHTISLHTEVDELKGLWDPTRLERVLANLLSNAVKYSPGGGEIIVSVRTQGDDRVILSVADRGIGIPEVDLPHVFDRFRRGQNAAGKIPGTGIGLAAVHDIVAQHNGTIEAANREGGGAIFTVHLPRSASSDGVLHAVREG